MPRTLCHRLLPGSLIAFLACLGLGAVQAADPAEVFEAKEFKPKEDGPALKYRILTPLDYDANKKYPVVLFLHGAGERGDDNKVQLVHGMKDFAADEMRKKHPAFVIAPQCPKNEWWTKRNDEAADKPADDPLGLSVQLIEDLKKKYSIDADRIYITGLSMGGYGSWEALKRMPDYFAAAIPICGAGDPKAVEKFKNVPVWVFHGDKDGAVKVERSQEMVEALKSAGASPKYTEYPGVGHDSWTATYKNPEVTDWLFEQNRGQKSAK
jgi:predicted peptidase